MITILPFVFCFVSVSLATQVTRTHHRGYGSPVPHSLGSPLPQPTGMCTSHTSMIEFHIKAKSADRSDYGIETNKWGTEHNPWVKRDDAPTTIPTRTHHQSHGSPVPYSPFSSLEGNAEASSLAEEIYQILEEYEKEIGETTSLPSGLPTEIPSSLIKRSPDTVTGLPDGLDPVTYNFAGPFGPNTADASVTRSVSEEEVISAEDPPFAIRPRPAARRGLTNVLSKFLPRKRMEGFPWASDKSHEGKQRAPRDGVNIAPRSKSVEEH